MDKTNSTKQVKTALLYATIAVLVITAIIAIFMIFFGSTNTLWQVMGTLAIIYLITLLSLHNMSRLNQPYSITRICAMTAMIFNLLWGIPWILIIWGAFGDNYSLVETVWRLVWTALIIAGYCTLLSTQLPQPSTWRGLVKVQQNVPLVLVTYVMFNAIIFVWTVDTASSVNLVFKLGCAELILILLQWAIPEILIRNQRKQSSPSPEAANDPTKVSSITTQVRDSATTPPSQEITTSQEATAQSSDTVQSVPPSNHATDPEHPQTVTETDDPVLTDKSSEN